jgi:hypothetical protein
MTFGDLVLLFFLVSGGVSIAYVIIMLHYNRGLEIQKRQSENKNYPLYGDHIGTKRR